jgi:hypothetical protein
MVPPTPGPPTATSPPPAAVFIEQSPVGSDNNEPEITILAESAGTACPASSTATYTLLPVTGPPTDHPDFIHGDFDLGLRGYAIVPEATSLILFNGPTAPDPPQLAGLFQPNRGPVIKATYQVNEWIWDAWLCEGQVNGCAGAPLDDWEVSMIGLATTPGETISIPERGNEIHPGGYKALVLHATETQITLGYTRQDSVAAGYVVHLQGVCVDPNLLALYRAQNNADGWRTNNRLPALRNDQPLGTMLGEEVRVVIRDKGSFMDPRSSKDWWRGY